MYAQRLLLAALIFSALPPSAGRQRDAAPTNRVTILQRLRSEFVSMLGTRAPAADDARLLAGHFDPDLTPADRARVAYAEASAEAYSAPRVIEEPDGLPGPQPTLRRGSTCWWLWVLFGIERCW